MTDNDYIKHIYDPNLIQSHGSELLSKAMGSTIDITTPTNPFTFLQENTALITSGAMQGIANSIRGMYPYLATTKEELYPHLNTNEIYDIFSTPSKGDFNLFINVNNMLTNGYTTDGYTEIIIPKYSNVMVVNTTFTTLNDIQVRLYESGTVFSKYMFNTIDLSEQTDVVLTSSVITDDLGDKWIMINLVIPQVKYYKIRKTLIKSKPFNDEILLDDGDMYTYMSATSIIKSTNTIANLNITYSGHFYDPLNPTLIIRPMDGKLEVELPSTYMVNGVLDSYVELELFTTKGETAIPLNKYNTSDYVFNLNIPPTVDPRIIGINNINYMVNSSSYTYGGSSEISFEELKNKIVNYSTGDNQIPITEHEIVEKVDEYGFTYKRMSSSILEREVLVTKVLDNLGYTVDSNIDIFYDNIQLFIPDIDSTKIKDIKSKSTIVIEPFQVFKYVGNAVVPLLDGEYADMALSAVSDIVEYNSSKYFFNLYKYVLDYSDSVKVRVYDTNIPIIDNIISKFNSNTIKTPIIITDRSIATLNSGYNIDITLNNNSDILAIGTDLISGQLKISLNNNEFIYFKGSIVSAGDAMVMRFTVDTGDIIDDSDMIYLYTDHGDIGSALVELLVRGELTIYNTSVSTTTGYNVYLDTVIDPLVSDVLYIEEFDIEFGVRLNNLFSNYYIDHTERKFLTYSEDVYLTYKEDVHELDENGLVVMTVNDTNDDIILNTLHKVGDTVMDENGDPIVLHYKGDVVIENDLPVIDNVYGIIHNLNILLLEDSFLRTSGDIYKNYRRTFFTELTNNITNSLKDIGDKLLDNTDIKFIPNNNLEPVTLVINHHKYSYNNFISPKVNIYISRESNLIVTDSMMSIVYRYLQIKLSNSITLAELEIGVKELLYNTTSDILSVKIDNIIPDDHSVINYDVDSSRFVISKKLFKSNDSTVIVKPDLDIILIKI